MLALPSLHSRARDDSFPILHTWMNSMTDDSMKAASELFISLKSESLDPCLTETVVAVLSAAQLISSKKLNSKEGLFSVTFSFEAI